MVVVVGVTTTLVPVKFPGFHVYDAAPVPVSVELDPAQMLVGEDVAVTVGLVLTFKFTVAVPIHPNVFVPVTEYVDVTVGVTTIVEPVKAPGFHVYVEPPVAVKVAEVPLQISVGLIVAEIVGLGLTVKVTVCVLVHPRVVVPITEYVVVVVGVTITLVPVKAPGFHVYVDAPLAVKVELPPEQIIVGEADATMVGVEVTFIVIVFVDEQPAAFEPITVYVVFAVGVTTVVVPVNAPGFQV